jgi:hypothetical protein
MQLNGRLVAATERGDWVTHGRRHSSVESAVCHALRVMTCDLRGPGLGIALELGQELLLEVTPDALMAPRQEVP